MGRTEGDAPLLAWVSVTIGLLGITIGTLYQKRFGGGIDWRGGLLVQYLAAGTVFALGAFAFETRHIEWTAEFVLAVAWLVFVLSFGAACLLYWLIRRQAATRLASLFYLVPPLTALMAWAFFGERLSALALAGMAVCAVAVALVNWRSGHRRRRYCATCRTRPLRHSRRSRRLLVATGGALTAQSVEEFYRGRTMPMVIGFSVGSGYDLYARLLARHMPRYIPGKPTIVPQNMPGAGSLRAAQFVQSVAPKDGSVIGTMSRTLPVEPLLGDLKLDGRAFTWIGNIANNNSLCATWYDTPIKTFDDVLTKPFVLGGEGSGSDLDNFALIMKNMFGAKLKLVSGYPGGTEVNLAVERRELDGRCGWSWDSIKSTKPEWLRAVTTSSTCWWCSRWRSRRKSRAAAVPLILDKARSDEQRQILRMHLAGQAFGRPFFAAPGIPEDRKRALRLAFDETMKDPEFVADALKMRLEVSPLEGTGIERILGEIYASPPEIVDKARNGRSRP